MNQTALSQMSPVSFVKEVARRSGEHPDDCYQCQKCSAGCPVAYEMDILPNQVMRYIQYGSQERLLASKTIWLCASCYACSTRCPNDIDIAKVMDTLRHLAYATGAKAGERDIPVFHRVFLDTIKYFGRIHEISMIALLKMKTRDFFKDGALGLKMFRRGKIKLFPSTWGGGKEIKSIFRAFEKGEKR